MPKKDKSKENIKVEQPEEYFCGRLGIVKWNVSAFVFLVL